MLPTRGGRPRLDDNCASNAKSRGRTIQFGLCGACIRGMAALLLFEGVYAITGAVSTSPGFMSIVQLCIDYRLNCIHIERRLLDVLGRQWYRRCACEPYHPVAMWHAAMRRGSGTLRCQVRGRLRATECDRAVYSCPNRGYNDDYGALKRHVNDGRGLDTAFTGDTATLVVAIGKMELRVFSQEGRGPWRGELVCRPHCAGGRDQIVRRALRASPCALD
jgi:hypothetical protein